VTRLKLDENLLSRAALVLRQSKQGVQLDGDGRQKGVGDQYAALGRLLTLSPDFELDLVDLDDCAAELRAATFARGVSL